MFNHRAMVTMKPYSHYCFLSSLHSLPEIIVHNHISPVGMIWIA